MRTLYALVFAVAIFFVTLAQADQAGTITAKVSLSTQTMQVYVGNTLAHEWPVSTAKRGYKTPIGSYAPYWLDKNHRSRLYDNASMPYSVFFQGNYAIHGTTDHKRLGQRASHGCVRLLTGNARILYMLVQQYGRQNTTIVIGS